MSRKWERMIEKNQKGINKKRKKEGLKPVGSPVKDKPDVYKGRNWMLPAFLMILTVFNVVWSMYMGVFTRDIMITFALYVVLAFLLVLINRPMLTISKTSITTRRFSGFKTVKADDIDEIQLASNAIIIQLNEKKKRWVYTRFIHVFPIAAASDKLKEFAANNGVKLVENLK